MPLACRTISNVALWLSKIYFALLLYVVDQYQDQEYLAYKMHFTDLFSWCSIQFKCLEPLGLFFPSRVKQHQELTGLSAGVSVDYLFVAWCENGLCYCASQLLQTVRNHKGTIESEIVSLIIQCLLLLMQKLRRIEFTFLR